MVVPCSDAGRAAQSSPITILVVEDEALIRHAIAEALRDRGVSVVEAANADEAWDHLTTQGVVDLVFTDYRMPGTMTGVQLASRIRSHYPHLEVIVTSGHFRDESCSEPILPKPYHVDQIAAVLAGRASKNREGGNR